MKIKVEVIACAKIPTFNKLKLDHFRSSFSKILETHSKQTSLLENETLFPKYFLFAFDLNTRRQSMKIEKLIRRASSQVLEITKFFAFTSR